MNDDNPFRRFVDSFNFHDEESGSISDEEAMGKALKLIEIYKAAVYQGVGAFLSHIAQFADSGDITAEEATIMFAAYSMLIYNIGKDE